MEQSVPVETNSDEITVTEDGKSTVTSCLNCETPLCGAFCYHCGQQSDVRPFTLKVLLRYFYLAFRKFDGEMRNTFVGLLFSPEKFCQNYLAGHRKPFAGPFRYFFVTFVFQASVFGVVRYILQSPAVDEAANLDTSFEVISLCMTVFWAVGYTIVFRKTNRNLAENIVCLLFISAEARIFSIVIQLVFLPFGAVLKNADDIQSIIGLVNTFAYFVYFSCRFYKEPLFRTLFKNFVVLILFLIACVLIFFIFLIVTLIGEMLFGLMKV